MCPPGLVMTRIWPAVLLSQSRGMAMAVLMKATPRMMRLRIRKRVDISLSGFWFGGAGPGFDGSGFGGGFFSGQFPLSLFFCGGYFLPLFFLRPDPEGPGDD